MERAVATVREPALFLYLVGKLVMIYVKGFLALLLRSCICVLLSMSYFGFLWGIRIYLISKKMVLEFGMNGQMKMET